jgi:hypothetical protein
MATTLHLKCDGCTAEVHSDRIKMEFVSFSGRGHGFGTWKAPDLYEVTQPLGWMWSDPVTSCTYCPACWEQINSSDAA